MYIHALDPGYEQSALVVMEKDGKTIADAVVLPNGEILDYLGALYGARYRPGVLVIEQIESMGMPVGRETFETVFWSGRFAEAWTHTKGFAWTRITRRTVKVRICGSSRATDASIRVELIDRYGGTQKAIGSKAQPGPLYRIKSHLWAALAVAVAYQQGDGERPADR